MCNAEFGHSLMCHVIFTFSNKHCFLKICEVYYLRNFIKDINNGEEIWLKI